MSNEERASRREFLRSAAKTATYSAPVIYSLAAPQRAAAQLSGKGMMNMGKGLMRGLQLMSTSPPGMVIPPWAKGSM